MGESVEYTDSAGQTFRTSIVDILQHVALHRQYHASKINLLFRHSGYDPAATDFTAAVRGVLATAMRLAWFGYDPYVSRSLQKAAASL